MLKSAANASARTQRLGAQTERPLEERLRQPEGPDPETEERGEEAAPDHDPARGDRLCPAPQRQTAIPRAHPQCRDREEGEVVENTVQ